MKYFCKKVTEHKTVYVWPKDLYPCDYLDFTISGMPFRENIGNYTGEHVGVLEPEPTNEHDPNAIKILAEDGHHIGYVQKDITARVREYTSLPCQCYFYIWKTKKDGYVRYLSCCYISNYLQNVSPIKSSKPLKSV